MTFETSLPTFGAHASKKNRQVEKLAVRRKYFLNFRVSKSDEEMTDSHESCHELRARLVDHFPHLKTRFYFLETHGNWYSAHIQFIFNLSHSAC